jgi:nicotinate-nucleotide adenylyltransferase
MNKRINIYGSACNPTHNVHQLILEDLCTLGFDEVWLMPCYAHMFDKEMIEPKHRLQIAKIIADVVGALVCDYEMNLCSKSSAWDTAQALNLQFPNVEFSFTIGGDNLAKFDKWYNWENLAKQYEVYAYHGRLLRNEEVSETILKSFRRLTIREIEIDPIYENLSSTEVRKLLKNNDPKVGQYIHPEVLKYIQNNLLYQGK